MPSIFNDKESQKFQNLCDTAFDCGEGTIAKAIWGGIEGFRRILFYILAGVVLIFGFIMGSFSIKKHFGEKKA